MTRVLLDTNIISYFLKGVPVVRQRFRKALEADVKLYMSVITHYEVLRGLYHKNAGRRLSAFNELLLECTVLPFNDEVMEASARLWAHLASIGKAAGDLDTLIGATTLEHGMVVVTNNEDDFENMPGLKVENWSVE